MSIRTVVATELTNANAFGRTAEIMSQLTGNDVTVRRPEEGDEVKTHYTGSEVNVKRDGVDFIFNFREGAYEVGINSRTGKAYYDTYDGEIKEVLGTKGSSVAREDNNVIALLAQAYSLADAQEHAQSIGDPLDIYQGDMELDDEGYLHVSLSRA